MANFFFTVAVCLGKMSKFSEVYFSPNFQVRLYRLQTFHHITTACHSWVYPPMQSFCLIRNELSLQVILNAVQCKLYTTDAILCSHYSVNCAMFTVTAWDCSDSHSCAFSLLLFVYKLYTLCSNCTLNNIHCM